MQQPTDSLETALRLYFEETKDYYSVIALARSADTVLGKVLESRGETSRLKRLTVSVAAIATAMGSPLTEKQAADLANHASNAMRHLDWEKNQPLDVLFDAPEEAKAMLERAIWNAYAVTGVMTDAMSKYWSEVATRANP